MVCPQCQLSNRKEFRTEIMIHVGSFSTGIPPQFTFPKAWVCLDCGCSMFTLPQSELLALREATVA